MASVIIAKLATSKHMPATSVAVRDSRKILREMIAPKNNSIKAKVRT